MAKSIVIPDLGTQNAVSVIEIHVKPGDQIQKNDPLITLESEKAAMEVPATEAGRVVALMIKLGDKVQQGDVILTLESATADVATSEKAAPVNLNNPAASVVTLKVPDLGNYQNIPVIEVNIKPGDHVEKDQTVVTLESEKATMEVPATASGKVLNIFVKPGSKLSAGDAIAELAADLEHVQIAAAKDVSSTPVVAPQAVASASAPQIQQAPIEHEPRSAVPGSVYAGPAVRKLARELGLELSQVAGYGRKGRIELGDLHAHVRKRLEGNSSGLPQMPAVDFTAFGAVELKPMPRIKKLSAQFLHRNWVLIPHVTQFDQADITDLEAFRESQKGRAQSEGIKLTLLVFLMKAVVAALKAFPDFNTSLTPDGQSLVYKHYFHIGVAVDTPQGLVVPVVRDVDKKGLFDLAKELGAISQKARDGKLTAQEMQGSSFSISSLGGVGGTAFTPIVNAPDVAILGVSKADIKPVYQDGQFVPRLMLPLSLSYDHRVIDGALAARFITYLSGLLADLRRVLL